MRKLASSFREPLPWTSVGSDGLKALSSERPTQWSPNTTQAAPQELDARRISHRYAQCASPSVTASPLSRTQSFTFSSKPEVRKLSYIDTDLSTPESYLKEEQISKKQAEEIQELYLSEIEAKLVADNPSQMTNVQQNEQLESQYTCGWAAVCSKYESDLKQLRAQLENECKLSASLQLNLQELAKSSESYQKELRDLKLEKEGLIAERKRLQIELDEKITENTKLEEELKRKTTQGDLYRLLESLKATLMAFDDENTHLKGHEESNRPYVDKGTIMDLYVNPEYQSPRVSKLEETLRRDGSAWEDLQNVRGLDRQMTDEIVLGLYKKVSECVDMVNLKNIELLNLQTAIGRYFDEHEAREKAEKEVVRQKEELSGVSDLLKITKEQILTLKKEKEDILSKLSEVEIVVLEYETKFQLLQKDILELQSKIDIDKITIQKLEENSAKIQTALEHSASQTNRLIMDSEHHVDRRVIVNLLVAYIQRNHDREVLELIMRILRFTDEDILRIGSAKQTTGKHIIDGILSFPSRIVNGAFRTQPLKEMREGQSLAELWVEFLQKDEDVRGKKVAPIEEAGSSVSMEQPPPVNPEPTEVEATSATVPLLSLPSSQQKPGGSSVSFLKCF